MKTITLFLAVVFSTYLVAYAQTTSIPDGAFEQALIDLGIDSDKTVNGQIATADAAAVTGVLDLEAKGISNLNGIEAFTSITELDCRFNSITNLDLTANSSLQTIRVDDNGLESISVDGLQNLTRFYATTNSLTALDFTGCTNLEYIYAGESPGLVSVTTTELNNINRLYVYGTGFTNLDVSSLPSIDRLRVDGCPNLKSLNVTGLTNMTLIYCYNTGLEALDLSSNSGLSVFLAYGNQDLVAVNLKGSGIGTHRTYSGGNFDLTGNSNLTCVEVDNVDDEDGATTNWDNDNIEDEKREVILSKDCYTEATATLKDEKVSTVDFTVTPNPVQDELTLEIDSSGSYSVSNLAGQFIIESGNFKKGTTIIDLSKLVSGIYILNLFDAHGRATVKIVKE